MIKKIYLIILMLIIAASIQAGDFSYLSKKFENKNYLIYINKADKQLYLIGKDMKPFKQYEIGTGEEQGRKLHAGDKKTPEGVYKITQILAAEEPGFLKRLKTNLVEKNTYASAYDEFKKNQRELRHMNEVFFKLKDGHKKYGTQEDLGYSVYGPAFLRLNYPNKEDKKRYSEALKKWEIDEKGNGRVFGMGAGIALHGTNDNPWLGQDASSGCVRMKNTDMLELLEYVEKGMTVIIEK